MASSLRNPPLSWCDGFAGTRASTRMYRVARGAIEMLGLWKFPDERPLPIDEVLRLVRERGQVIHEKMLWPVVFTQALFVVRKQEASTHP